MAATGKEWSVPVVSAAGSQDSPAETFQSQLFSDETNIFINILPRFFGFDACVATPDMMGTIGKIARLLGPKGLMPNPKSGTVTMDVTKAINDIKAGKVEYRIDKTAIAHCPIGKISFENEKLVENLKTLMDAVIKAKPASSKGTYIRSLYMSSTMGPAIKLNSLKF